MKVLLVSDIHSNWEAWQAVWKAAEPEKPEAVWCMGDITGYGPDPYLCVKDFQSLPNLQTVMGNHDRVVAKVAPPIGFNPHAINAAIKNISRLSANQIAWLAALPNTLIVRQKIMLCHGSPINPDEYLLTPKVIAMSFEFMKKQGLNLVFFGHTHLPAFYEWNDYQQAIIDNEPITNRRFPLYLNANFRYLINPGSVGQPRDGNPWAAYAILDIDPDEKNCGVTFHRIPYQIEICQEKMRRDKFPETLIKRLEIGY